MAPPRRKARTLREPRNYRSTGRCGVCGKVAHDSRSAARRALRNQHPGERGEVNVYQCAGSVYWHVGHKLPSWVRAARAES